MNKKYKILLPIIPTILVLLLILVDPFYGLDTMVSDKIFSQMNGVDNRIKIIAIDEATLAEFGPFSSWVREKSADLINVLYANEENSPAVLAFDVMFIGESDNQVDTILAEAANNASNIVFASNLVYQGKTKYKSNGMPYYDSWNIAYLFDFSGPKKYDELNDYHTQSMVAIPMIDAKNEVIGVMQLINATENGRIRAYTSDEEHILLSLASQTAIALSNMAYVDELNQQLWSFTEALTEAIDARTPYNASHTRNVAKYAGLIADHINNLYEQGKENAFFSKEQKDQLVMAAYLHDIGKMIIPIEVMNKQTRLEHSIDKIYSRLDKIKLKAEVDYLSGKITESQRDIIVGQAEEACYVVDLVNAAGFLDDEKMCLVDKVSEYSYISPDGSETINFFMEDEKDALRIRKGTLTDEERKIMESHVQMTERILSKVHFNKSYAMAPVWAAQHHECIDGSGYPNKISGDELGIEARILAVADICDALLATDRPYKKPMPKEKAFAIMNSMVEEGKLEGRLVSYLKDEI